MNHLPLPLSTISVAKRLSQMEQWKLDTDINTQRNAHGIVIIYKFTYTRHGQTCVAMASPSHTDITIQTSGDTDIKR